MAHAVTSGIISIFVWSYFQSVWYAAVSFAAGVLIDLDHLIDYYASHPFTANARTIYFACLKMNLKKLYIVLHSYEIIACLWIAIYVFSLENFWKAVAIGLTQHIIFDQIVNPMSKYSYFIVYRIAKGFRRNDLIEEAKLSHGAQR